MDKQVVKNTNLDMLKEKINNLERKISDVTTFILINQYNTDKQNLEKKKIEYVDEKIPDINGLVITAVLNSKIGVVKNKIPDVSDLVKKTDYDTKILKKYFTTADYNKFTVEILDAQITQKKIVNKSNVLNLVKILT